MRPEFSQAESVGKMLGRINPAGVSVNFPATEWARKFTLYIAQQAFGLLASEGGIMKRKNKTSKKSK